MLLNHFLEESAQRLPGKIAVIAPEARIPYSLLHANVSALAHALVGLGLEKQGRVGIYLENSAEAVTALFAVLQAGGVFVPINPQVKAPKIEYLVNDCRMSILITDDKHVDAIQFGALECPSLKHVVVTGYRLYSSQGAAPAKLGGGEGRVDFHALPTLVERGRAGGKLHRCIDIDLASLIYTSGSTGNPKGVTLTHLNMVTAATSITTYLENVQDDVILDCLPFSFDYGLYQILMSVKMGSAVVLERNFAFPARVVEILHRECITGFPIVPAMSAILMKLDSLEEQDFSHVRYVSNTGQALPSSHIQALKRIFKRAKIFSMYGLTECKRVSFLPPEEIDRRPLSVGKAIPNTEVWLVDAEGARVEQPNIEGELVIRGAHVMKGYWNQPEDTARVLKPGLFPGQPLLYSGDLFHKDEEGFLYFHGRKDDMIKSGGQRIGPREIEEVICQLPEVVEAAVVGTPDDILGNAVKAFIVCRSEVSSSHVIEHCQQSLENYKVPREIEFVENLPRTSSGKVDKRALKTTVV